MAGWDTVYDRLLTVIPAATSVGDVYDGPPTSETWPDEFIVVGDNGAGDAGSYTPDFSDVDYMTDESGEILCLFVAQSGATADLPTLRATVGGWVGNLRTQITTDKRLGVLAEGGYVNVSRVEPSQLQTSKGAVVSLVVTISYFTRY